MPSGSSLRCPLGPLLWALLALFHFLSSAAQQPTLVATPEELVAAVNAGAPDIVVTADIDLRDVPSTNENFHRPLDISPETVAIRGDCPGGCNVVVKERLLRTSGSSTQLKISDLNVSVDRGTEGTDSGSAILIVVPSGNLFLENVKLAGDGDTSSKRSVGIIASGHVFASGAQFSNFDSGRGAVRIRGATSSLNCQQCTFTNIETGSAGGAVLVEDSAVVALQDPVFQGSTAAGGPEVVTDGTGTVYSNAAISVFDGDGEAPTPPTPLAELTPEDESTLLGPEDDAGIDLITGVAPAPGPAQVPAQAPLPVGVYSVGLRGEIIGSSGVPLFLSTQVAPGVFIGSSRRLVAVGGAPVRVGIELAPGYFTGPGGVIMDGSNAAYPPGAPIVGLKVVPRLPPGTKMGPSGTLTAPDGQGIPEGTEVAPGVFVGPDNIGLVDSSGLVVPPGTNIATNVSVGGGGELVDAGGAAFKPGSIVIQPLPQPREFRISAESPKLLVFDDGSPVPPGREVSIGVQAGDDGMLVGVNAQPLPTGVSVFRHLVTTETGFVNERGMVYATGVDVTDPPPAGVVSGVAEKVMDRVGRLLKAGTPIAPGVQAGPNGALVTEGGSRLPPGTLVAPEIVVSPAGDLIYGQSSEPVPRGTLITTAPEPVPGITVGPNGGLLGRDGSPLSVGAAISDSVVVGVDNRLVLLGGLPIPPRTQISPGIVTGQFGELIDAETGGPLPPGTVITPHSLFLLPKVIFLNGTIVDAAGQPVPPNTEVRPLVHVSADGTTLVNPEKQYFPINAEVAPGVFVAEDGSLMDTLMQPLNPTYPIETATEFAAFKQGEGGTLMYLSGEPITPGTRLAPGTQIDDSGKLTDLDGVALPAGATVVPGVVLGENGVLEGDTGQTLPPSTVIRAVGIRPGTLLSEDGVVTDKNGSVLLTGTPIARGVFVGPDGMLEGAAPDPSPAGGARRRLLAALPAGMRLSENVRVLDDDGTLGGPNGTPHPVGTDIGAGIYTGLSVGEGSLLVGPDGESLPPGTEIAFGVFMGDGQLVDRNGEAIPQALIAPGVIVGTDQRVFDPQGNLLGEGTVLTQQGALPPGAVIIGPDGVPRDTEGKEVVLEVEDLDPVPVGPPFSRNLPEPDVPVSNVKDRVIMIAVLGSFAAALLLAAAVWVLTQRRTKARTWADGKGGSLSHLSDDHKVQVISTVPYSSEALPLASEAASVQEHSGGTPGNGAATPDMLGPPSNSSSMGRGMVAAMVPASLGPRMEELHNTLSSSTGSAGVRDMPPADPSELPNPSPEDAVPSDYYTYHRATAAHIPMGPPSTVPEEPSSYLQEPISSSDMRNGHSIASNSIGGHTHYGYSGVNAYGATVHTDSTSDMGASNDPAFQGDVDALAEQPRGDSFGKPGALVSHPVAGMGDRVARPTVSPERLVSALNAFSSSNSGAFLDKYVLQDGRTRATTDVAVTQLARGKADGLTYAIKFYTLRSAFERERQLFENRDLAEMLPPVTEVVSNDDGSVTAPDGWTYPPFIITDHGAGLDKWMQRKADPGFPATVRVLRDIALQVKGLHSQGLVHRNLTPEGVLWRPTSETWALTDFGCAVPAGSDQELSNVSLDFAAPEVVHALEAGNNAMRVDQAADIWALGMVAYELLTRSRAFPAGMGQADICDQIVGRKNLPWEEDSTKRAKHLQLRSLRPSVLACLNRNLEARPSAAEVYASWDRVLRQSGSR